MAKKHHDNSTKDQPVASTPHEPQVMVDNKAEPSTSIASETATDGLVAIPVDQAETTVAHAKQHSWRVITLVMCLRLVVGGMFVFSGFVKAIDPWGSYYKLVEYANVLGLDTLSGLSLFGAFALATFEFVLGVMLVTGSCRKVAPLCATVFMLVMTPLTLWLAITNAVDNCGCFGDFVVLSNWATLGKNVVLLAGCVCQLVVNKRVKSVFGPAVQWMVITLSFAYAMTISFNGYLTQPLLDFRPYKTGTQLKSQATSSNGSDYVFIYEKDGLTREFVIDSVPDDDSGWTYVDRREVKKESTPSQGQSIAAWDGDDDVSDSLLSHDKLLLILLPDIGKVSVANTFRINELQAYADQCGASVAALTSGTDVEIVEWNDLAMAHYPIFKCDDSEIKTIARGNPAVVYVHEGKIEWKLTLMSIDPELIHRGGTSIDQLDDDYRPGYVLRSVTMLYLLSLLVVLLVNRTHLLVGRLRKVQK